MDYMGRPKGSKNGVRNRITRSIGVPIELDQVILALMEEDGVKSYSEMVVRLVKAGVGYRFLKDKQD